MKLAEMREMLDACGHDAEVFLTLSSTTKVSDIKDLLKTFEPFGYQAIILTKLDETQRLGNVISVIAEYNKPVAFLTDGQSVPQDIHEASVPRLLMNLDGFKSAKMSLRPREGRPSGAPSGAEYVKNGVWGMTDQAEQLREIMRSKKWCRQSENSYYCRSQRKRRGRKKQISR